MLTVILDTNVLVAGLRSQFGASYYLLQKLGDDIFQIALSVPLVLQYESVLKRVASELHLALGEIDDFIDYVCDIGKPAEIYYLWRPILTDPNDDMVLELAVKSQASIIVTHNVRDFSGSDRFGIEVMTPKEFLIYIRHRYGSY